MPFEIIGEITDIEVIATGNTIRDLARLKKDYRFITVFAICIDNKGYPASLERHKLYRVVADEDAAADGDVRIIDESGEDYLYPAHYFVLLDLPQSIDKVIRASFSNSLQPQLQTTWHYTGSAHTLLTLLWRRMGGVELTGDTVAVFKGESCV